MILHTPGGSRHIGLSANDGSKHLYILGYVHGFRVNRSACDQPLNCEPLDRRPSVVSQDRTTQGQTVTKIFSDIHETIDIELILG